jgi:hypothetical protein
VSGVRIEVITEQKIYFTMPLENMEDMQFPEAMLAEMNVKMDATQKGGRRNESRQSMSKSHPSKNETHYREVRCTSGRHWPETVGNRKQD